MAATTVHRAPIGIDVEAIAERRMDVVRLVLSPREEALFDGFSWLAFTRAWTAKEAVLKEDLFRMRDAIDQYYADKNRYPSSLDELVSDRYLRGIPVDPFTNSADTWQTELSEPEPGNAAATPGIFNVKSGAEQASLDGTNYAEW